MMVSGWKNGVLTNLFGDVGDGVPGQVQNQETLEDGDELRDLQQPSPVDLPLLDLVQLDQTFWQRL